MKTLATLLLAVTVSAASAQIVYPSGTATVPLNWHPHFSGDSLRLDVDGDHVDDVVFRDYYYSDSQGSFSNFYLAPLEKDVQLGSDNTESDCMHRFQAGEAILPAVRWDYPANYSYLDFFVYGNGGIVTRGLFRDGKPGYLVFRKPIAGGGWRYWWVYLTTQDSNPQYSISIFYYGGTDGALAAAPTAAPPALAAYPNPAATAWHLPQPAAYQLYDSLGRLVSHSSTPAATIEAGSLTSGLYSLRLRLPDGSTARQTLVRQ